jgi:hypothetical protein
VSAPTPLRNAKGANADSRMEAYWPEVQSASGRMVSLLDRERHSRSYGSFDREHWGWKFRDFPLGMLQSAVYPLALLWSAPFPENPYFANSQVLSWIEGAMRESLSRQHANGSFDYFAPNEQNPGTTLGLMHGLCEAFRLVRKDLPEDLCAQLRERARKAYRFAMSREEDHAFVSNHHALFAVAWLDGAELLGEPQYSRRAAGVIESILGHQSPDGWYREYDGPDPGYESLGIFHLAVYWQRTRSTALLESLRCSIAFYSHFVHPDGSVGGAYGSRQTSLYFPGGFEILAGAIPTAAAIARFMRRRLGRRNVLTPPVADPENVIPMLYTYLEACLAPEAPRGEGDVERLPCESQEGMVYFPGARLCTFGARRYYAVANLAHGGVCRIFDKQTERIAYEDGSYLVTAGGRRWTAQRRSPGLSVERATSHTVSCERDLAEDRQLLPTPVKFLLFRVLSLTAFRSQKFGNLIRRLIIRQLITKVHLGPLHLRRTIEFNEDEIRFRDRLERTKAVPVREVALPRSYLSIHMGSAKYFRYQDLESTPEAPAGDMAEELNRKGSTGIDFVLRLAGGGGMELVVQPEEKAEEAVASGKSERQ